MQGKAYRITIYIGEDDHYRGKPLYLALLEMLRRSGALGATASRGPSMRISASRRASVTPSALSISRR